MKARPKLKALHSVTFVTLRRGTKTQEVIHVNQEVLSQDDKYRGYSSGIDAPNLFDKGKPEAAL